MDAQSIQWLCGWLQQMQGVSVSPERLTEPRDVVARITALMQTDGTRIPFDSDPTGFTTDLEELAAHHGTHE